jgi:hypothetical protein
MEYQLVLFYPLTFASLNGDPRRENRNEIAAAQSALARTRKKTNPARTRARDTACAVLVEEAAGVKLQAAASLKLISMEQNGARPAHTLGHARAPDRSACHAACEIASTRHPASAGPKSTPRAGAGPGATGQGRTTTELGQPAVRGPGSHAAASAQPRKSDGTLKSVWVNARVTVLIE